MTDNIVNLRDTLPPLEFTLEVPQEEFDRIMHICRSHNADQNVPVQLHIVGPYETLTIITDIEGYPEVP